MAWRSAPDTIVDATILHAPSSTKNKNGQRDPEMHQVRKGRQWYFGRNLWGYSSLLLALEVASMRARSSRITSDLPA